ncbi:ENR1 protein, partial [Grantiella picta]|nr:ENR1 protein [Grantiella picta]
MSNHIIRLQVVVEIKTNKTALALKIISNQQRQTKAAVCQNKLALDYLLAEEGGVRGKF